MTRGDLEKQLRAAANLDLPYPDDSARGRFKLRQSATGSPAAVLILFGYPKEGASPEILFTKRTEIVSTHKGQMSFPGGACEPDEVEEKGFIRAAQRETQEEVGIPSDQVQVVGVLPPLFTVTGFLITPVLGILKKSIEDTPLEISTEETAETVWIELSALYSKYQKEKMRVGQIDYPIHVFQIGEYRIWGATGSMTKNLLDRLAALNKV